MNSYNYTTNVRRKQEYQLIDMAQKLMKKVQYYFLKRQPILLNYINACFLIIYTFNSNQ